mmetsp:Transcript_11615/g.10280  ORF Transcript_11615/g.10280 Transcript_11615/m.10280 type:complete len:85 (-) Transcript_11615:41-295(-)
MRNKINYFYCSYSKHYLWALTGNDKEMSFDSNDREIKLNNLNWEKLMNLVCFSEEDEFMKVVMKLEKIKVGINHLKNRSKQWLE